MFSFPAPPSESYHQKYHQMVVSKQLCLAEAETTWTSMFNQTAGNLKKTVDTPEA